MAGEFGEYDCDTTYVSPFMTMADQYGIGYLGWSFNDYACGSPLSPRQHAGEPPRLLTANAL